MLARSCFLSGRRSIRLLSSHPGIGLPCGDIVGLARCAALFRSAIVVAKRCGFGAGIGAPNAFESLSGLLAGVHPPSRCIGLGGGADAGNCTGAARDERAHLLERRGWLSGLRSNLASPESLLKNLSALL